MPLDSWAWEPELPSTILGQWRRGWTQRSQKQRKSNETHVTDLWRGSVEKEGVNLFEVPAFTISRANRCWWYFFFTRLRITSSSCVSQIMESRSTSMLHLFPWGPHLSADTIPRCWSCCKYWGVPSLVSFLQVANKVQFFPRSCCLGGSDSIPKQVKDSRIWTES